MRNSAMIFGFLVASACYGQTSTVQFDVVSVKMHAPENQGGGIQLLPNGIRLANLPLPDFIREAYGLAVNDQIVGIPSWAISQRFDIEAKVDSADVAAFRKLTLDQIRLMGRPILTSRFKLMSHEETKVLPVYALVVGKGEVKLKPSTLSGLEGTTAQTGVMNMRHASPTGTNELTAQGVTMDQLAKTLSKQELGRVVVDDTGLAGKYDFTLSWTPDSVAAAPNPTDTSGPSIFTAVSEQLGLKLESEKGPVPVLVIDHIEAPSPN